MSRVNITGIVAERWIGTMQDMRSDNQIASWDAEIAEVEYAISNLGFYSSLRPLIGLASEWEMEWDGRTSKVNEEKRPLDAEIRTRFLNVLKEMREDEQFHRYCYELDDLIRHIDEEVFLVYGLQRIKNEMDVD